eukprot:TRINITY_DN3645_c0_g1_i1.p1 TRINITY_DN3645_c0_g1~~TRINITY_DN3645_c0_g1_i1.p1  ORF type:complete len:497 (+),score=85.44 TRINITY_DN3645_c0_g1_i1:114-1604(+)
MATIVQRLTRKTTTATNKKLTSDENTTKLPPKKTIVSSRTQVLTSRQPLSEIDSNSVSTSNIPSKGKKNSAKKATNIVKTFKQKSSSNLPGKIASSKNVSSILVNQVSHDSQSSNPIDTTGPLLNSQFEGQQKSSVFGSKPNISYLSENFSRLHALVTQTSLPALPSLPGFTSSVSLKDDVSMKSQNTLSFQATSILDISVTEKDMSEDPTVDEISHEETKIAEIRDIDAENHDNPSMSTEYVNDIYAYLKTTESSFHVPIDYLKIQDQITPSMRTEMIDWMSEVCLKFRLLSESFFLSVNIMDRYLAAKKVPCGRFQLLGATSMIIASKHEEIYFPEISDFVYISDNAFCKRDVVELEHEVLVALNWSITAPTSLIFLRRYSVASGTETRGHTLSKFMIELALPEYDISRTYLPSQIAAGAVYLSRRMLNQYPYWDPTLAHYTGYKESEVVNSAQCLNEVMHRELSRPQKELKAVTLKYQAPRFCSVAKIPLVHF